MIGDGTTAADGTSTAERTAEVGVCQGSVGTGSAGADRSVREPDVRSHRGGTASESRVRCGLSAISVRSLSRRWSDAGSVRHPVPPPATDGRTGTPARVEEVTSHDSTGP